MAGDTAAVSLFWSALDEKQRKVLRTVHKEKVSGAVSCACCQDLLQFALRDVDAKVDWIDPKRRTTAFLSKGDDDASFRWTDECEPDSIKFHGDSCELLGSMKVVPHDPGVTTPFSSSGCVFCSGQLRLRFVNMLTYPRPIRKFDLLLAPSMTLEALYALLAEEVGFDTSANLRLMVRGKTVGSSGETLADLGWADSSKTLKGASCVLGPRIVISQVLGAQTLAEETKIKNKQFVGDLLFGQPSTPPPTTPSAIESTKRKQGAQILGAVVEDLVQRSVHGAWVADCKAREHENQLLLELEREDTKAAKKERKKGKKKARERQRKEAQAAERRAEAERARKQREQEAVRAARLAEQAKLRAEQERVRAEEEARELEAHERELAEERRRNREERARKEREDAEAKARAKQEAEAAERVRAAEAAKSALEDAKRQERHAAELAEAAANSVVGFDDDKCNDAVVIVTSEVAAAAELEAASRRANASSSPPLAGSEGMTDDSAVACSATSLASVSCRNCGTDLSSQRGARFCWACGHPTFETGEVAASPASSAAPPPKTPQDAAASRTRLPIFASLHGN